MTTTLEPGVISVMAEAMWQAESLRCLGKQRLILWDEENPQERKKWYDLALAANLAAMAFNMVATAEDPFPVGKPVEKQGGEYLFPGTVVASFLKIGGQRRYVVEDDRRSLHIFSAANLRERAATPTPPTPVNTAQGDETSQAARDVLAERRRQVEVEGWTPEHDDAHDCGEIAIAAACYATAPPATYTEREWMFADRPKSWPWHSTWWKPTFYRRNLVKAGALIVSEIERLDRRGSTPAGDVPGEAQTTPDSTAQGDGEPDDLLWLRYQVVALCEDTEDKYSGVAENDHEGKQGAFARGRITEAKSIRRAIAEVVRCRLAERTAQGDGTIPCDGCGATQDRQRCIGCLHDFGDEASAWVRKYTPVPADREGRS